MAASRGGPPPRVAGRHGSPAEQEQAKESQRDADERERGACFPEGRGMATVPAVPQQKSRYPVAV
jgi:hypothetical protein